MCNLCNIQTLPLTASKPALLLTHGFGANLFHWRRNVPELSKHYNVYAISLLGFGMSDKPLVCYGGALWRDQLCAFIKEVIGCDTVIAGNSLGGYAALAAAASFPEMIKGCVLLNAAGRFDPVDVVMNTVEPNEQAKIISLTDSLMVKAKVSSIKYHQLEK
jgi:pimeloyl-ACP methyl ester carboxylesterase